MSHKKQKIKLPREVQDPEAVKTLHQSGKLEPLLNVIEFGSEGFPYLIGQPIRSVRFLSRSWLVLKTKQSLRFENPSQRSLIIIIHV